MSFASSTPVLTPAHVSPGQSAPPPPHSPAAAQCQLERQILQHVKDALRITLRWEIESVGLDRKLSSVRFTAHSFVRHLERIMDLEESGGYLDVVEEAKPQLMERAAYLLHEHAEIRASVECLSALLNHVGHRHVGYSDERHFDEICLDFLHLLDKIDRHDEREMDLIQEALYEDVGGEG